MVVTDKNVKKLEKLFFSFSFLESNKKSNAELLKQMQRCLRNNSIFFFGLGFLFLLSIFQLRGQ